MLGSRKRSRAAASTATAPRAMVGTRGMPTRVRRVGYASKRRGVSQAGAAASMRAGRRRPRDAGRAWPTLDRGRALVPPAPAASDASGPEVEARAALVADDRRRSTGEEGGHVAGVKVGFRPTARWRSDERGKLVVRAGHRRRRPRRRRSPLRCCARRTLASARPPLAPAARGADGGTAVVRDEAHRCRVGHLRHRRHGHLADGSRRRLRAIVRLPGCACAGPRRGRSDRPRNPMTGSRSSDARWLVVPGPARRSSGGGDRARCCGVPGRARRRRRGRQGGPRRRSGARSSRR